MAADLDKISRQRIDFEEHPDGSVTAILTVTLPGGQAHRYRATVDEDEVKQFAHVVAQAEARMLQRVEGELSREEIAGIFDSIAKGIGSVVNVAKKVVTGKVFKTAAKGLAAIAPALGPLAPAALAVSGGMGIASKVANSAVAAEGGARRAARALSGRAVKSARVKTRGKSRLARGLVKWANRKRKGVFGMLKGLRGLARTTSKRRKRKPTKRLTKREKQIQALKAWSKKRKARRKKSKPKAKARPKRISILAAARTGRLRSNKPGDVSEKALKQQAKKGRVYWITA